MASLSRADDIQQQLMEEGYPGPQAPISTSLPPGEGHWAIPHFLTFAEVMNQISRTYRYTFDEAIKHSLTNFRAIRRDPVVIKSLRSRQMPVAQLEWHLEPQNPLDPFEAAAAERQTQIIKSTPRWQTLLMSLLEAVFYGRYGVQWIGKWDFVNGRKQLRVRRFRPVNGDKFVFKWDERVGVLVHAQFKGDWEPTDRGRAHFLTPAEREQLILHMHEPEDSDFMDGDTAGAIHGLGIRGRIYWFWWLRTQVQTWMMDYLERVGGGGFNFAFYEAGNDQSLSEVQTAIQSQLTNNWILFPRYKDGSTGGPGIEHIDPTNAGVTLLIKLITEYFDTVIRQYIQSDQVLMDQKGLTIGSGGAEVDMATMSRIIKYDALNLAETLTTDFLQVLYKYNEPGCPPARWFFEVDKPNAAEVLDAATSLWNMGGAIDEDHLRSVIGLPKPEPNHSVLIKSPPMMPGGPGAGGEPNEESMDGGDSEPVLFRRQDRLAEFIRLYNASKQPVRLGRFARRSGPNYLSIGFRHAGEDTSDIDAWLLPNDKDDLDTASKRGWNPDDIHLFADTGDMSGRIDHKKKMISVTSHGGDDERRKYAESLLKMDYPGYDIIHFNSGTPLRFARGEFLAAPAGGANINGEFYSGGEPIGQDILASLPRSHQTELQAVGINDPIHAARVFVEHPVHSQGLLKKGKVSVPEFGMRPHFDPISHSTIVGHLNPPEIQLLKKGHMDRLLKFTDEASSKGVQSLVDAAELGQIKRPWYSQVAQGLNVLFEHHAPRFGALLAATSPRSPVKKNLLKSLKIWSSWLKSGALSKPDEIKDLIDKLRSNNNIDKFTGHDNNIVNALSHPDPGNPDLQVLSGPKVDSFRRNLLGYMNPVTNDIWQMRLLNMPHSDIADWPEYLGATAMGREVTARLNQLPAYQDNPWKPAETQAAQWSSFRTLSALQGTGKGKGKNVLEGMYPVEALAALTHQSINDTVDFLSLLKKDPEVHELLSRGEAAGIFAGSLAGLRSLQVEPSTTLTGRPTTSSKGNLETIARRASTGQYFFFKHPEYRKR